MAQISRPKVDVYNSGWGPTPLSPHVNTPVPNDAAPVATPQPPGGSFIVQLQPLARPAPGPQTLIVRLGGVAPGGAVVSFYLLQACHVIAGRSVRPTGALTSYDLVLTPAEIARITDYTKLQVLVAT